MDKNVSDIVRVAQIAAESNESIVFGVVFVVFIIAMFWSVG